jgi:hypothetical protein
VRYRVIVDPNVLEVFNIHPLKGVLRGNEEFKITVSFTPKVRLSYCIVSCYVISDGMIAYGLYYMTQNAKHDDSCKCGSNFN